MDAIKVFFTLKDSTLRDSFDKNIAFIDQPLVQLRLDFSKKTWMNVAKNAICIEICALVAVVVLPILSAYFFIKKIIDRGDLKMCVKECVTIICYNLTVAVAFPILFALSPCVKGVL